MAMNAQVSFLDGALSLIHIPLELYSTFLQPILQVLLPPSQNPSRDGQGGLTIDSHQHGFLNISVTPIECSIVCKAAWAKSVFEPAIQRLSKEQSKTVAVSKDKYVALSVTTAAMDAGSRIPDLTSPLALAEISIFFITTYYTDFILVPIKDRQVVLKTLLARGFVFSEDDQSRLVSADPSPTATTHGQGFGFGFDAGYHSRGASQGRGSGSGSGSASPPGPLPETWSSAPPLPPPSSIDDLQERTFALLKKRNVVPHVEPDLTLVHCTHLHIHRDHHQYPSGGSSGRRRSPSPCWADTVDTRLYTSLVAALAAQPRFLSVTLAHEDPPSLLLDRALLGLFGDALAGPTEGLLVPVFLDLADLPFEATGIVSGVAGRLVREMKKKKEKKKEKKKKQNKMKNNNSSNKAWGFLQEESAAELSYLSTARAGAVVLSAEQAGDALAVLRSLLERE